MITRFGILPCVERGADLGQPLHGRNDRLAGHVAAALGKDLVLDEQARDARLLVEAHRPRDVGDVAEAGVGVGEQRQRRRVAEAEYISDSSVSESCDESGRPSNVAVAP